VPHRAEAAEKHSYDMPLVKGKSAESGKHSVSWRTGGRSVAPVCTLAENNKHCTCTAPESILTISRLPQTQNNVVNYYVLQFPFKI
jgi:hypothetical protein